MDLVLLKPGDDSIVTAIGGGGSQISGPIQGMADDTLDKCIELVSVHYGMKQQLTTDVSNTARTSGRPELHDVTCVKYFDKTSPTLYKHCLSAIPLDDGKTKTKIFICRNSNWKDKSIIANIMTIELEYALLSTIQSQSHPNDMATEQFTLNYTGINWTYTAQGSDAHSNLGNVAFGWSVRYNRNM